MIKVMRTKEQMRAIYAKLCRHNEATQQTAAICVPGKVRAQWGVRVIDEQAVIGCVEIAMGVPPDRRIYALEVTE